MGVSICECSKETQSIPLPHTNLYLLDNNTTNIKNNRSYNFLSNLKSDNINQGQIPYHDQSKNININIININKEQPNPKMNSQNYSSSYINNHDTNKMVEQSRQIKEEIVPEELNEKNEEEEEEDNEENNEQNDEENEEIEEKEKEKEEEIIKDPEYEKIKQNVIKNFDNKIKEFGEYITDEKFIELENNNTVIQELEKSLDKIKINYNKYIKSFLRPALLYKKDKSIYKGCWNFEGKKEGFGIFYDGKGNKYIGEWEKDQFNGKGRIISLNGDCYDGEFNHGVIEGNGIFISKKGGYHYSGQFKNNKFHGHGKLIYDDNTTYEGNFSEGYMSGEGNLLFRDGSYYKGTFEKNNYNGKGIFNFQDGRKYNGDWKNSVIDGEGVFSWDDDTKYKGHYKNFVREGNGVYSFGANLYDGHWIDNMPHGEGTLLNEGLRIVGEFRYGKMVEVIESKGVNRDISQKFTFDKKGILKQETDIKSTKRSIMKTDGNFKKHHHHHKKNDSSKHHKDKSKEHKKHKDKEKEKDRDNKSHRSKNK